MCVDSHHLITVASSASWSHVAINHSRSRREKYEKKKVCQKHDSPKLLCFLLPITWSGHSLHVNGGRCEVSHELVIGLSITWWRFIYQRHFQLRFFTLYRLFQDATSHTNAFSLARTHTHTLQCTCNPARFIIVAVILCPPSEGGSWRVQTVAYLHFDSLWPVLRSQSAVHDFSTHTHIWAFGADGLQTKSTKQNKQRGEKRTSSRNTKLCWLDRLFSLWPVKTGRCGLKAKRRNTSGLELAGARASAAKPTEELLLLLKSEKTISTVLYSVDKKDFTQWTSQVALDLRNNNNNTDSSYII